MDSNIFHESCFVCRIGVMVKISDIESVHSYDYNKDGYLPHVCDECGSCSDVEKIIPEKGQASELISNHCLKEILTYLCDGGRNFDYHFKKEIYSTLKDENIISVYDFADTLHSKFEDKNYLIKYDFIVNTIYSIMSKFSFN